MKITVINGTERKGCTFAMKEMFMAALGQGHEVSEFFLPRDCPHFCSGCKACSARDISVCPHAQYTVPLWENMLAADLLVFTSPTYVGHVTGQMKALLDHYVTKWTIRSPEKPMFGKQAVVIANASGQGMGRTARDIRDSLDAWGIAYTYTIKMPLFQPKWKDVPRIVKITIEKMCKRTAAKVLAKKRIKPRLKIQGHFFAMRMILLIMNIFERKAGRGPTKDYLYWQENGWFGKKRPWKD